MIHRVEKEPSFIEFLESAYDEYYDSGDMPDFAAITLGKLEDEDDDFSLEDCLAQVEYLDSFMTEADEGDVSEPEIVKEKKGNGVSVKIKGHEYRYVSPDITTGNLYNTAHDLWANGGQYRVINFLKKNALCYYGAKNNNPDGKKLVGIK